MRKPVCQSLELDVQSLRIAIMGDSFQKRAARAGRLCENTTALAPCESDISERAGPDRYDLTTRNVDSCGTRAIREGPALSRGFDALSASVEQGGSACGSLRLTSPSVRAVTHGERYFWNIAGLGIPRVVGTWGQCKVQSNFFASVTWAPARMKRRALAVSFPKEHSDALSSVVLPGFRQFSSHAMKFGGLCHVDFEGPSRRASRGR